MAFRLESPDDLELFEDKLERNEYRVQRVSMGDEHALGEAIRFTAPSEHRVELYYDMRLVGNGLPLTNPDPYPDGLVGIHPPRMDHTLLTTPEDTGLVPLLERDHGLPADRAGGHARRHADRGVDGAHPFAARPGVHSGQSGGMHHFAFWLDDWSEIGRAADVIVRGGSTIKHGPTRHGITRGHTIYFFDPSGNRNEVFTGGYWADPKMEPITWTADKLWQGIFYWDGREKGSFVANYT